MNEALHSINRPSKKRDELIATDFLISSKSLVRAYAVAITETASPDVRKVLTEQLNKAIQTHAAIAGYMIDHEMYHAHDLKKQLKHDQEKLEVAKGLL
ncbi:spore gernimation protein GerQ [Exiguobacterium indicum]|uniref:Spore gernimation protein GerQ n=1 Tax=Exiguobacterium indicum TaxID=296995 RepID=A0A0V8GKT0_9BACL|nr:spore coat protein [Exiguobacterium enclense]KSU50848.1 spore gernimation protein GerQ [Exiguobacterium enclense]SDC11810.1 similar to spore coat protein [Exiguobacterium enclense]